MRAIRSECTSAAFCRREEIPDQDSICKASAQDQAPTVIHGVLGKVSDVAVQGPQARPGHEFSFLRLGRQSAADNQS